MVGGCLVTGSAPVSFLSIPVDVQGESDWGTVSPGGKLSLNWFLMAWRVMELQLPLTHHWQLLTPTHL